MFISSCIEHDDNKNQAKEEHMASEEGQHNIESLLP